MGSLLSLIGLNPDSLAIKAGVAAIALVGAFAFGVDIRGRLDASAMEKQTLQYEEAVNAANQIAAREQQQIDAQALAASDARSNELERQNATLQAQLSDVPVHVSAKLPCITYGLVRVLDAAILSKPAGNLALPPGKSDGSCSPFTADDLARTVISNYSIANSNATQLNALEALLRQIQADRAAAAKAQK